MKNSRQDAILKLISDNIISTQEDLLNSLVSLGYQATQSTVSRDIKELRIVKALDSFGNYRYISSFNKNGQTSHGNSNKYIDMFKASVVSVKYSMNDVVIRCYSGMASSVCVAIDHLYSDMIVGSLAGDDTIFIIAESEASAKELCELLQKII